MKGNIFVQMAVMAAVFQAAVRDNAMFDWMRAGNAPHRRMGRGRPGAYGKGLRKAITQKNLARRANGERMVAA